MLCFRTIDCMFIFYLYYSLSLYSLQLYIYIYIYLFIVLFFFPAAFCTIKHTYVLHNVIKGNVKSLQLLVEYEWIWGRLIFKVALKHYPTLLNVSEEKQTWQRTHEPCLYDTTAEEIRAKHRGH